MDGPVALYNNNKNDTEWHKMAHFSRFLMVIAAESEDVSEVRVNRLW